MPGIEVESLDGEKTTIGEEALTDFRARVRGDVVLPTDSSYEEVRVIWNAMIDRRPAMIVRCTGTADVMQAVRFANENKLLVSIRGGGHNIAGMSLRDDAMLIDLSLMRSVHVDPDKAWSDGKQTITPAVLAKAIAACRAIHALSVDQ